MDGLRPMLYISRPKFIEFHEFWILFLFNLSLLGNNQDGREWSTMRWINGDRWASKKDIRLRSDDVPQWRHAADLPRNDINGLSYHAVATRA